jgi:hypothetical protein
MCWKKTNGSHAGSEVIERLTPRRIFAALSRRLEYFSQEEALVGDQVSKGVSSFAMSTWASLRDVAALQVAD